MPSSAGECRLLGGAFASFVQVCLATLCITTLAFKRYGEVPQRPWVVWALDVGKQSVGSSFGHFSNIFLSEIIATAVTGGDECQWYCLSFVLDSTLGTFVNLGLLQLVENVIRSRPSLNFLQFGDYGDPPSLGRWSAQLGIWLILVILGKLVCISILVKFSGALDAMISYIFQDLRSRPQSELIVVMIIVPGIFNVISFWITDTFLKQQENLHQQIPVTDLDEDLLEMNPLSSELSSNFSTSTSSIPIGDNKNRSIAVAQKRMGNSTSSLISNFPTDSSPNSTQVIWDSATRTLPDMLVSLSTCITGPSRGLSSKSSDTDLKSLSKEDEDN